MEVFQKFFCRIVTSSAPQIFPSLNRQVSSANNGNYKLLVEQMDALCTNPEQAKKIATAIETANEDIFRDFDLSTFMEHFKLDALEKTILALAFKTGSRPDLKTKGQLDLFWHCDTRLTSSSKCHTLHQLRELHRNTR